MKNCEKCDKKVKNGFKLCYSCNDNTYGPSFSRLSSRKRPGFKPAKSPQHYFITYNQSLFDYLQNNVSIIKFDLVLAFISQILASC